MGVFFKYLLQVTVENIKNLVPTAVAPSSSWTGIMEQCSVHLKPLLPPKKDC